MLVQSLMGAFRSGYSGPERRKNPRKTVIDTAWIDAQDGTPPRVCVLWDISESGARLTLTSYETLPDEFVLRKSRRDPNGRRCHVVWRSSEQIGVEFILAKSETEPL
jgi:hypothetical protein